MTAFLVVMFVVLCVSIVDKLETLRTHHQRIDLQNTKYDVILNIMLLLWIVFLLGEKL